MGLLRPGRGLAFAGRDDGVDARAQTTAGTVHAYGCSRVSVSPLRAVSPVGALF